MNKVFRLITFGLILCIALITGCSKGTSAKPTKPTNTINSLEFDESKAILMVLKYHPEFPTSQSETITKEIPTGGPPGAAENVKFITKVDATEESTYVVTLIKDWGISVNGKYAKSSWKYNVTPNSVTSLEIINNDYLIEQIK